VDRLAVSVSEGELHEVAALDEFETDGPFLIELSNRGRDAHVHLRLDDALAGVATLAETNPHVPRDETVEIVADVDAVATPVTGRLTVETGYGADGTEVAVTVTPPASADTATTRASDGGTPAATPAADGDAETDSRPVDSERLSTDSGVDPATVAVVLLAVCAVGAAAGAVALVADPVVAVGAAVAVVAVALAALLLRR